LALNQESKRLEIQKKDLLEIVDKKAFSAVLHHSSELLENLFGLKLCQVKISKKGNVDKFKVFHFGSWEAVLDSEISIAL
jgi:hypothetical protein